MQFLYEQEEDRKERELLTKLLASLESTEQIHGNGKTEQVPQERQDVMLYNERGAVKGSREDERGAADETSNDSVAKEVESESNGTQGTDSFVDASRFIGFSTPGDHEVDGHSEKMESCCVACAQLILYYP